MDLDNKLDKNMKKAAGLLRDYKGNKYTFGLNCLDTAGKYIREFGSNTLLIISESAWTGSLRKKAKEIFNKEKIKTLGTSDTSAPNTPVEDVFGLADMIRSLKPASIACFGGGSAIDCAKAANALACLGDSHEDLELFFGTNNVSMIAEIKNEKLYPLVAVQLLAGSASHLTRYSNVTFPYINQKKLIVDDILIPDRAVFDYSTTVSAPKDLTLDGAMDGMSHALEAYYGADRAKIGNRRFALLEEICLTAISMIVETLPMLADELANLKYREIIGLATDLGGYSIMFGGTNGAHLNSYSLVDILSHGRACAVLNPYYTVFFAPSINGKLIKLAGIFKKYLETDMDINKIPSGKFSSRELGEIIASAMIAFSNKIGFPFKLSQISGFTKKHIENIIESAKNPQLEMKLKNMPVPLNSSLVDEYMRPVILAAQSGDFSYIKNLN